LSSDQYDGRGQLYRSSFAYMTPSYEVPAPFSELQGNYDFIAGVYVLNGLTFETGGVRHGDMFPEKEWSPDALAGSGVR